MTPIGSIDQIQLVDHAGEPFSENDFEGSIWVVDFFFTRCPSVCPRLQLEMKKFAERYANEPRVQFLSITVDTEFDEPEVLAAFAEKLGLPLDNWRLTTGDPRAIRQFSEHTLKLAMGTDMDENGDIAHSTKFVLIDAKGDVRGFIDGLEESEHPRFDAMIQTLLAE
jgi:protein SCO1/2